MYHSARLRRKGGFLDTFVFLTKENNGCTRTPYTKKPEMSSVKDFFPEAVLMRDILSDFSNMLTWDHKTKSSG